MEPTKRMFWTNEKLSLKNQTKWPMRKSFSLVQNILFVGYIYKGTFIKVLPAHQWEKLWETMRFGFLIVDPEGNSWCPYSQHPLLSGGYRPGQLLTQTNGSFPRFTVSFRGVMFPLQTRLLLSHACTHLQLSYDLDFIKDVFFGFMDIFRENLDQASDCFSGDQVMQNLMCVQKS